MSDSLLTQKLSLAALTLIAAGSDAHAQSTEKDWELDTSYLSYTESDDRVSVSKVLVNLQKQNEVSNWQVNLINDTMSGASPTGAIVDPSTADTTTGASGASADTSRGFVASTFEDTRRQAGFNYSRELNSSFSLGFGAAVSRESDFDSQGGNMDVSFSSANKLTTYQLGVAFTNDSIFRSDTEGTPRPLGNVQGFSLFTQGTRSTVDTLLGVTRILNPQTYLQLTLTFSQADGYHSDPYKVISAADDNDQVVDTYHDSRPTSRERLAAFSQLVHQVGDSKDSVRLSYRWYQDDWGISSHTVATRYRHILNRRQYVEPNIRFYQQSQADFYQRKLDVDANNNPILPVNGLASSDYRLDELTSTTVGIKYGYKFSSRAQLRVRAEYLTQRFTDSEFDDLGAVIFQTSFGYRF